jgi:hypothetical protein
LNGDDQHEVKLGIEFRDVLLIFGIEVCGGFGPDSNGIEEPRVPSVPVLGVELVELLECLSNPFEVFMEVRPFRGQLVCVGIVLRRGFNIRVRVS